MDRNCASVSCSCRWRVRKRGAGPARRGTVAPSDADTVIRLDMTRARAWPGWAEGSAIACSAVQRRVDAVKRSWSRPHRRGQLDPLARRGVGASGGPDARDRWAAEGQGQRVRGQARQLDARRRESCRRRPFHGQPRRQGASHRARCCRMARLVIVSARRGERGARGVATGGSTSGSGAPPASWTERARIRRSRSRADAEQEAHDPPRASSWRIRS